MTSSVIPGISEITTTPGPVPLRYVGWLTPLRVLARESSRQERPWVESMGAMPMHADEIDVPETLVRALVDRQFPQWAGLPLRPVSAFGTDHRLFRLGEDLLVRMPVYAGSADQAISDATWLPRLAPHLPVAVPVPVALESRTRATPSPGRSCRGCPASHSRTSGPTIRGSRPTWPSSSSHCAPWTRPTGRGQWHRTGNAAGPEWWVEDAIVEHGDLIDVDRARAVWHTALEAGPWPGPDVWIHGDLLGGNLLVRDGRLSAVIDWGPLKVADPAPDVAPAWTLLEGDARRTFRDRLDVDDATWARARAWVMLPALAGIRYYEKTVPAFSQRSRRHLDAARGCRRPGHSVTPGQVRQPRSAQPTA